jgi:hypothetical protein
LVLLGRHRVVCGDLAGAAAELLRGEEDALVVHAATRPPADGVIRYWQERTGGTAGTPPAAVNLASLPPIRVPKPITADEGSLSPRSHWIKQLCTLGSPG